MVMLDRPLGVAVSVCRRDVMGLFDKIGLVLLALMLIPLVAVIGPTALGAIGGAVLTVGMMRVLAPRR